MQNIHVCVTETPIGRLAITVTEKGVRSIHAAGDEDVSSGDMPILASVEQQVRAYFDSGRPFADLPIALAGTEFQIRVWEEAMKIPLGETITYGELAERIGHPQAARAVGTALGKNRLLLIVPCHRIVGSSDDGGFALGMEIKKWLLAHEAALAP